MARKKYMDRINKPPVPQDTLDANASEDVSKPEKAERRGIFSRREPEPALPETGPGVTLMAAPDRFRPAFIKAGRIPTYAENVMVGADGFARVKTKPAIQALKYRGFTVVREAG